jgi:hypothetical protein
MWLSRHFGVIAILAFMAPYASGVYETVVIEKPFHVRSLSGITLDPSGALLPETRVDDCDRDFKHVLATTMSDQNGRFVLRRDGRSVHYLKFTARGMNPLEITVELRVFARANLKVKLPIGG